MTGSEKDSAEVVKFMALFARIKEWTDDDPTEVVKTAQADDGFKKLCDGLFFVSDALKKGERKHREMFAAPVDPAFQTAWRDYEQRYATAVASAFYADIAIDLSFLAPLVGGSSETPEPPEPKSKADELWDDADFESQEQMDGIEEAIEFARDNISQSERWDIDQEEYVLRVEGGIETFKRLQVEAGFDLRGIFRRRALIPFILVPRKMAAKEGALSSFSMLMCLRQAHDAFIFGAPLAALALMRSIMESILRDHYRAAGVDLNERIKNAAASLPPGANEAALHRLRMLANEILHRDQTKAGNMPIDQEKLEKEILSLLFVVRALIEGAYRTPSKLSRGRFGGC
jgi:hypothetical protein